MNEFDAEKISDLEEALAASRAEVELERMRLAACGVAAMGNTPDSVTQRIEKDSPYYSASYSDVCRAVDHEIALRAEVGRLSSALRAQDVDLLAAIAAIDVAGPALEVLSAAGDARASAALLEMRVAADAIKSAAQPAQPPI